MTAIQTLKANEEKFYWFNLQSGEYALYERVPSKHSCFTFLGTFTIHKNGKDFIFNKGLYNIFESMVVDMKDHNATLPFDSEIYDPTFRKHYRIEMALNDYLERIGLERVDSNQYVFKDVFGNEIFTVQFLVNEDTTTGKVTRQATNPFMWSEAEFTDLDSAVDACASLVAQYLSVLKAQAEIILSKIKEDTTIEIQNKKN